MDISIIKNYIKEFIKLIYICPHYKDILNDLRESTESKIVLFGTSAHGNLGDQAIAISEMDFLSKIAHKRKVIEIPMPLLKTHRRKIKNCIGKKDTVIISGGGWMGNLWIHNEITIREIVEDYINNRVIIFPQTLYYIEDEIGRQTASDTKKLFDRHNNLILTVRDYKSFNFAKNNLGFIPNKNLLFCPDMVVYGTLAPQNIDTFDKKKAIVCLRSDIEKKHNTESIKSILHEVGYTISETTTVINKLIPMSKRNQIVEEKIHELGRAAVVVTDRLHAMLFSLLAGTPCIAFDNTTGKVFGVGEYLKSNGMPVFLADKLNDTMIESIDIIKSKYLLTEKLNSYFNRLEKIVNLKETENI